MYPELRDIRFMLKEANGKVAIQIECHRLSVENRTVTLTNRQFWMWRRKIMCFFWSWNKLHCNSESMRWSRKKLTFFLFISFKNI